MADGEAEGVDGEVAPGPTEDLPANDGQDEEVLPAEDVKAGPEEDAADVVVAEATRTNEVAEASAADRLGTQDDGEEEDRYGSEVAKKDDPYSVPDSAAPDDAGKEGESEAAPDIKEEEGKKVEEKDAEYKAEYKEEDEDDDDKDGPRDLDIGSEDAEWLLDDNAARVHRLAAWSGVELTVSEDGRVKILSREGVVGGGVRVRWAEVMLRATCAWRGGRTIDISLPRAVDGWTAPVTVLDVPGDEVKGFILGKGGLRLFKLSEESNVVAVFSRSGEAPQCKNEAPPYKVGELIEAKFGNKDRYFEAKILEVLNGSLRVKWTYDDDIDPSVVELSAVKQKPAVTKERLYIFGEERGRMELEVKALNLIEAKMEGYISSSPRTSDKGEGVGWTVAPLLNDGELKAKLIGKGGSVRIKISKACGSTIEYIGNYAYIVGTGLERARTVALLDMIQRSAAGGVEEIPAVLEGICTRVEVPQDASAMVIGKKRATMNALEDDTGTLTFWAPRTEKDGKAQTKPSLKIAVDAVFEGKHVDKKKGVRWFPAKIVEILKGDENGDRVRVQWEYDETEFSDMHVSDLREVLEGEAAAERTRREREGTEEEPVKTLAVFGQERARKRVELRVLGTIEVKCPGHFTGALQALKESGLEVEVSQIPPEDVRIIPPVRLEAISVASNCVCECVAEKLVMAGTPEERRRCLDYLTWGGMERPSVPDAAEREDIHHLMVPEDKRPNLTDGVLADVEKETSTFIFFDDGARLLGVEGCVRLLVCGSDAPRRTIAVKQLGRLQNEKPQPKLWSTDASGGDDNGFYSDWPGGSAKKANWSGGAKDDWGDFGGPADSRTKGWGPKRSRADDLDDQWMARAKASKAWDDTDFGWSAKPKAAWSSLGGGGDGWAPPPKKRNWQDDDGVAYDSGGAKGSWSGGGRRHLDADAGRGAVDDWGAAKSWGGGRGGSGGGVATGGRRGAYEEDDDDGPYAPRRGRDDVGGGRRSREDRHDSRSRGGPPAASGRGGDFGRRGSDARRTADEDRRRDRADRAEPVAPASQRAATRRRVDEPAPAREPAPRRRDSSRARASNEVPAARGSTRRPADDSRGTRNQDGRTVVVARLAGMNLNTDDLVEAFTTAGAVERAALYRDHALVTFKEAREASFAVKTFDGGKLGDRIIEVYMEPVRAAAEPEPKRARRSAREEDPPARSGRATAQAPAQKPAPSGRAPAAAGTSSSAAGATASRGAAGGRRRSRTPPPASSRTGRGARG